MARTDDAVALNDWYAVAIRADVSERGIRTRLLGQNILIELEYGRLMVWEDYLGGRNLPAVERYGCVWTTLGNPTRDLFRIAEAEESDRRVVLCGWYHMRTSGLRMVENFIDMAHFPFVHHNILGAAPHTEVPLYECEIRRDVDEVWATNCRFFQPRIAVTETAGDFVQLTFRVMSPFCVMLYRVCPSAPSRLDAIALFVQPIDETVCRAQPVMYLVDAHSPQVALLQFEQVIFSQDRIIIENQRPLHLPLDAQSEIPTRADSASVLYRRWLKEKGLRYGTWQAAQT